MLLAFSTCSRVGDGIPEALGDRRQDTAHRLGVLFGKIGVHQNRIAVEAEAVIGHQQRHDVFLGDTLRLEVENHREDEAEHGVDIALRQHRLAHREADAFDRDRVGVELVHLRERAPLCEGTVRRRRAERLAFERLRIGGDPLVGTADDGESRLFVNDLNGFDRLVRVRVEEFDQRVDVAEAHLVGAGGAPRDCFERTVARVDRNLDASLLEVAALLRQQEAGCRPFELPIEREAYWREILSCHRQTEHRKRGSAERKGCKAA